LLVVVEEVEEVEEEEEEGIEDCILVMAFFRACSRERVWEEGEDGVDVGVEVEAVVEDEEEEVVVEEEG